MSSDADPDHARQTHFDLVMDKVVDKVLVEKVDKKARQVQAILAACIRSLPERHGPSEQQMQPALR